MLKVLAQVLTHQHSSSVPCNVASSMFAHIAGMPLLHKHLAESRCTSGLQVLSLVTEACSLLQHTGTLVPSMDIRDVIWGARQRETWTAGASPCR